MIAVNFLLALLGCKPAFDQLEVVNRHMGFKISAALKSNYEALALL